MIHSYPFYLSWGFKMASEYTEFFWRAGFRLIAFSYRITASKKLSSFKIRYWTSVPVIGAEIILKLSKLTNASMYKMFMEHFIHLYIDVMEESNISSTNGSFWALIWCIRCRGRAEVTKPQSMSLSNFLNCLFRFNIFQTFLLDST